MDFLSPEFFSAVGFPAAIAFYVLRGVNETLKDQNETLKLLNTSIEKLTEEVDQNKIEQLRQFEKIKDEVKELRFKVEHMEARRNVS